MSNIMLEVCVDTPESIRNAMDAKADRLELCSSLIVGGLTPSIGLVKYALTYGKTPCNALIRPRNGNFVFSSEEIAVMEEDIKQLRQLGVHGFVIGALTQDGEIDIPATQRLIQAAGDADITFHRAFDLVVDAKLALQTLIELGVSRILTSGQQATALKGVVLIRELQQLAGNKLSIMAGAGVDESNAKTIITQTGISEIHASCKRRQLSRACNKSNASMGGDAEFDHSIFVTDKTKVQALKKISLGF